VPPFGWQIMLLAGGVPGLVHVAQVVILLGSALAIDRIGRGAARSRRPWDRRAVATAA
jgi:hypothetical protein